MAMVKVKYVGPTQHVRSISKQDQIDGLKIKNEDAQETGNLVWEKANGWIQEVPEDNHKLIAYLRQTPSQFSFDVEEPNHPVILEQDGVFEQVDPNIPENPLPPVVPDPEV